MSTSHCTPSSPPRDRRGSALILVLIMTLSLAGLAISAIYLSSSAGLLTRYYDKERDYRYSAEAALALGKSRVNRDTTLMNVQLPSDTALAIATNATLSDAGGTAIPKIRYNLYGAYTGDTVGRYGQFVTLVAQAFDSGGTRHVRRLDLTAESFSRFAMFVDSFPSGLAYGTGEFIRGRSHSNTNWYSGSAPGPIYYDTLTAFGTVNGTATYVNGYRAGVAKIPYPTVAKLAALPGYAATGSLSFTPVSGTSATLCNGTVDLSGRTPAPACGTVSAVRGTRVRFKPVDVANDGAIDEQDGMMMIFDIAAGIDTSSLRADLLITGASPITSIVLQNQCGLLATIAGRKEFFPVARFREPWVVHRLRTSATAPAFTWPADSTTMVAGTAAAYSKILSYGVGFSRCFPAGSPYLMLTERYVTNAASCTLNTTTGTVTAAWAAPATTCAQYGGQDTTFTPTVTRCAITQAVSPGTGVCTAGQVQLGAWRAWPGAALPAISSTIIQAVEKPYLWPLFKPYNMNSKGVVHATTGPIFLSDTLRGNVTLYVIGAGNLGKVELIDDLVYDQNPTDLTAICRNFLGIIAQGNVMIADNAIKRPRRDPAGTFRFLGSPHATLNMVTMSLTGTVGVDNYAGNQITTPAVQCQGYPQSGGCINQTGGVIEKVISATYAGNNTGFRENRSVDPCQLTNRRPPFFPATGRYLDNKYYEIDPVNVDTWAQVKTFYSRLRGQAAP